MKSMKDLRAFVAFLIFLIPLTGCASFIQGYQVAKSQNEISSKMNALMGRSSQDVVLALGAPTQIQSVAGIEVYKYHQNYGTRTQASAVPNQYIVNASANSWESYDSVNVYFKNGVMIKWDGYVQR